MTERRSNIMKDEVKFGIIDYDLHESPHEVSTVTLTLAFLPDDGFKGMAREVKKFVDMYSDGTVLMRSAKPEPEPEPEIEKETIGIFSNTRENAIANKERLLKKFAEKGIYPVNAGNVSHLMSNGSMVCFFDKNTQDYKGWRFDRIYIQYSGGPSMREHDIISNLRPGGTHLDFGYIADVVI